MRVLFLSHRYADTKIGGLAEFLHHLPPTLRSYGVESMIYTRVSKSGIQHLEKPEYLSNEIPHYSGPFLKPSFFISNKELEPLIKLCEKEKIDLIHAQGTYRAGYMAMHAHKKTGIPYLVTSHSDVSETNSERIQRMSIRLRCKKILKNAAAVTHLTPFMADASHKIQATHHKSKIIHNGIAIADWDACLNYPEQNYMLAIGRLEPEKGFGILIDAYAELIKQGIKTSLIIAGTGSIEKELQTQAKNHGIRVVTDFKDIHQIPQESIIFTGYIRSNDKKNLFSHAKLVLFATQPQIFEEAFGIVQVEAMTAGKALIASDMATTRYLQSFGLQATLVKPDDIQNWTQAILTLLDNQEKRLMMGQLNREAVKQFDWKIIAKEYADVYQSIISTIS